MHRRQWAGLILISLPGALCIQAGSQTGHAAAPREATGLNPTGATEGASATMALVSNPPAVAPAPHNVVKNRYVSFAPNNGGASVAFSMTRVSPGPSTGLGWVDTPDAAGLARIVPNPVFRIWNEAVVHVGDCPIIPVASYEISSTDNGVDFSLPLVVNTIPLPSGGKFWGDTVGTFDGVQWTAPNGIVGGGDLTAVLQALQGLPQAPHWTWADLAPDRPDGIVDCTDMYWSNNAFQGNIYPFSLDCSGALGACDLPGTAVPANSCVVTTAAGCSADGGAYQGDGTTCVHEACCTASDTCVFLEATCCAISSGYTPMGPGTVCLGDSNGDTFDDACVAVLAPPLAEVYSSPCATDDDCLNEASCIGGVCYAPKNRYFSFQPNSGATAVAFEVRAPVCGTLVGYVGTPAAVGGSFFSSIVPAPVFRVWGEPVVHVGDCAVFPGSRYEIRATDGVAFSAPLTLPTVRHWGDTVGGFSNGAFEPPDGCVNALDVQAVLRRFQGFPNAPPVPWADVMSVSTVDPCLNRAVSVADVLEIVQAAQGAIYPFSTGTCPICPGGGGGTPCPCLVNGECDDGFFCNGAESCQGGLCTPGDPPCPVAQVCDEVADTCVACTAQAECDDGAFCNGAEQCLGGDCVAGTYPCAGQGCDEAADVCDPLGDEPPTIELIPTGATGAHSINGNLIALAHTGQQVTLEFRVSNWDSNLDGDPIVGAYQAVVDSLTYGSGDGDPLTGVAGFFERSCVGGSNPGADCSLSAAVCAGGGVCTDRADLLMGDASAPFAVVKTTTPDYQWSIARFIGACDQDDGNARYAGTLVLDVPAGAVGTYTIEVRRDRCGASLNECNPHGFPKPILLPAIIEAGCACEGDIVGINMGGCWTAANGIVNANDVLVVAQCAQGTPVSYCAGGSPCSGAADIDCDGDVDPCDADRTACLLGGGTDCCGADVTCGACCTSNPLYAPCTSATQTTCENPGGVAGDYQGDDSDCTQFPCACDENGNNIADVLEVLCASCSAMGAGGEDHAVATGAFKVVYLDGSDVTIAGLADADAVFGRSAGHYDEDPEDSGAVIPGGGSGSFPDTSPIAPDPCVFPAGFPEGSPPAGVSREVHIEMLSLNLTGGGEAFRVGQAMYDSVFGDGRPDLYRDSFGEAQGLCIDFPAEIFFNVFAEIEVGGEKLYNKSPIILRAQLNDAPIDLSDPNEDFINDPTFPAVALFNAAGVHRGYLASVSFGGGGGGVLPPASCEARSAVVNTVSFAVDATSNGVLINNPNDVNADATETRKKVTVYGSSGAVAGSGPDTTNARYQAANASLHGVVGGGGGFLAGDAITSASFGRDGTVNLFSPRQSPVLFFSVDRSSQGALCTDVRTESDKTQVAADVFIARTSAFGAYDSPLSPPCPLQGGHCLVIDQSSLGLAPLFAGIGHDNVTALEVSTFTAADRAYLTITGLGADATIWTYDGDAPFQRDQLVTYATAGNLGLQAGDVIDALVVSDVTPGASPQAPNGVRDATQDDVLFSLAPGSPTLTAMSFSAADVFRSRLNGSFSRLHTAASLGLLATDNIDGLDVSPGTLEDCNGNGIGDRCDIDRGFSADGNDNGLPDECETFNRYVAFYPEPIAPREALVAPTAFRVELVASGDFATTGVVGWLDTPTPRCDGGTNAGSVCTVPADCPGGGCLAYAKLSATPVLHTALPSGGVYLGDCGIAPVARYAIRATTSPPGGPFDPPVLVETTGRPTDKQWGDTVGTFGNIVSTGWDPPNGIVNVNDFVAILEKFQDSRTTRALLPALDVQSVSSTDPCLNRIVNIADVFLTVKAFQGEAYPFMAPTLCATPCP